MQHLLLLGLNHATTPLEVREKLAFAPDQVAGVLHALRQRFDGCEAVLLCTCNRVELYAARAVHGRPRHEEMAAFLAEMRGIPVELLKSHWYEKAERAVVEHLFSVVSSLDSMVIGETQILGQVRDAYDAAQQAGAVGSALHPLFQRAVGVGKQVMSETRIAEGRVSIGSVAVDCAGRIFDHYNDKTVLCIGAGKMAGLVLRAFAALKPKRMLVCNRDPAKAAALVEKFGGEAVPFEKLGEHLVLADVVVTSTGSQLPIITKAQFEPLLKQRRYRPVFLIDIALPRDVEASVAKLENVYLYNIDDLQQVVAATRSNRSGAVDSAKQLIAGEVDKFVAWHRTREMGPLIDRLYQRQHALAKEEVERTLAKLAGGPSPVPREQIEELARRIVNKMLHDPITTLRNAEPHSPAYLHALEKLFQLGDDPSNDGPKND